MTKDDKTGVIGVDQSPFDNHEDFDFESRANKIEAMLLSCGLAFERVVNEDGSLSFHFCDAPGKEGKEQ